MRLSLQQKEQFFHEMRELVRSGRSVPEAVDLIASSRSSAMRRVAVAMRAAGGDGSADQIFSGAGPAFGSLDREIIRGGEASGRIAEAMGYLSGYYGALDRTRKRLIANTLYPIFLLHFGAVALAVPQFFTGGLEAFLKNVFAVLAIFYVLVAAIWFAFRSAVRAAEVNPAADQLLQAIPALGGTRLALVGSRFCMLMAILVKATGGILSAFTRSATASGSALFQRGAGEAVAAVQGGDPLGAAVARTRAFPEGIDRAFQVGETSGRLDEEMERQAARFTEQFNARLDLISSWVPKLIFLGVALWIAWSVIRFWQGYAQILSSVSP